MCIPSRGQLFLWSLKMSKHLRALLTIAALITVFGSVVVAENQKLENTEVENSEALDQSEAYGNEEPEIEDEIDSALD